jgi:REP element-mobilizing transposase RayT
MKRFVNLPTGSRSRRLNGHDYGRGTYFITTRTFRGEHLFGGVERGRMYLDEFGQMAFEEWQRTGELRSNVTLDAFVIMPNHIHGILCITRSDPADEAKLDWSRVARLATTNAQPNPDMPPGLEKPRPGTLSTIVGAFKSAVTRRINRMRNTPSASVWQPSFYDRIIRSERALFAVRRYIRTNPPRWHCDRFYS